MTLGETIKWLEETNILDVRKTLSVETKWDITRWLEAYRHRLEVEGEGTGVVLGTVKVSFKDFDEFKEMAKELMLYKTALEIACEEFSNYGECLDFPMCTKCFYDSEKDGECSEEFKNYFLKQAREAAEDGKQN